ncbi:MAG TPA: hypothetical protein VNO14_15085, partial [Blastocatellia bacterium]|nr:hypothetical protein [Blastocatellia bacterium]
MMSKSLWHHATFVRGSKKLMALFLLAVLLAPAAAAQQPAAKKTAAKRPLTHADYDSWRSIQSQQLSRDGKFLAYLLVPQDGDGEVVVRNLATGAEWRHPRGAQPVNQPPQRGPRQQGPPSGARLDFTADSRFAVFQILPTKAEIEKAKKDKKKPEDMPKNAMGIMDLATGKVTRIERVKSFQIPDDGAAFIAYLLEPKPEEKKEEKRPEGAPAAPAAGRRSREKKKEYGSDLVLRNLADNSERTFGDVLEYSFSKDAKSLVYAVSSKKEETNGLYSVAPATADAPVALLAGPGKYTKITWDEKQTQLAFLSDRDDAKSAQPRFKLYHWDRRSQSAAELVSTATAGFREGYVISERGAINFSLDGSRLFFGVAPAPEPEKQDEDAASDDKVVLDLWHWKDEYIQPMQKVRAEQERNRSYRAVFHLGEKKFVQLTDETMESVNPASDGRWALGSDDRQYRRLVGYDTSYSDYFLVNTADGSRKPLIK